MRILVVYRQVFDSMGIEPDRTFTQCFVNVCTHHIGCGQCSNRTRSECCVALSSLLRTLCLRGPLCRIRARDRPSRCLATGREVTLPHEFSVAHISRPSEHQKVCSFSFRSMYYTEWHIFLVHHGKNESFDLATVPFHIPDGEVKWNSVQAELLICNEHHTIWNGY